MKIKPINLIKITTITLLLSSCASMNTQPSIQNKVIIEQAVTAIETSEGSDTIYIHNGTDKEILCASRGNDFAFTQAGGNSLFATRGTTTSAGIDENSSAGVAELGGVNSGVLITREIMYRTCEFMGNLKAIGGLTPDIANALFQKALDAVLQISGDYKAATETTQTTGTVTSTAPSEK